MADDDPPDWREVFRKPAADFEGGAEPDFDRRKPSHRLADVPEHVRRWLDDISEDDVERLMALQKLAKDTDLERLSDLVDLAEKATTVRKFGQWAAAVIIGAFLLGASLVDAVEKLWGWLKGVPK